MKFSLFGKTEKTLDQIPIRFKHITCWRCFWKSSANRNPTPHLPDWQQIYMHGFFFIIHHQILKELKPYRRGSKVVSWVFCICKYTCLPFLTRCTQGFGQCGWMVANLQRILFYHSQLQQSPCSSQASQMHRELTCVVWKTWISKGCRPVASCAQKGTKSA